MNVYHYFGLKAGRKSECFTLICSLTFRQVIMVNNKYVRTYQVHTKINIVYYNDEAIIINIVSHRMLLLFEAKPRFIFNANITAFLQCKSR